MDFKCDLCWENSAKLDALTQLFAILRETNQIKLNTYQCNKLPHDITYEQKSTLHMSIIQLTNLAPKLRSHYFGYEMSVLKGSAFLYSPK